MLKSYLITAIRNLRKNRLYSAINILGLALGIACCLVIFVIVRYETSFDDYHRRADRIYRVNLNLHLPQGTVFSGNNYAPLAEAIRDDVVGLETATAVYCLKEYQFSRENDTFEDTYAFFADQHYFEVFDADWIAGNQQKALSVPNSVVVTDVFAEKYLGGTDLALGTTFTLEHQLNLTVSGIVAAPPSNTDHPYSLLIAYPSLATLLPELFHSWQMIGSGATYVVITENTYPEQLYPPLKGIIRKYLEPEAAKNTDFFLLPLADNHDRNYEYSSFTYDFPVPVMVILAMIAAMIAFIACINFVNLATAQSLNRAKEVGIRKLMGSSRWRLVMQYMSEAFVITLASVIVGLVIARVAIEQLNQVYGGDYLQFQLLSDPATMLFILGITVLISILAGFYPAFVLSGYSPVTALKAQSGTGKASGLSVRRGLVIGQFAGAQILILVTVIMINQIHFFKDRSYSYDPENIVIIPTAAGEEGAHFEQLHYELNEVAGIVEHSFGSGGRIVHEFYKDVQNKRTGIVKYVDTAYLNTFAIELLAGKNFSQNADDDAVIINEAMVEALGLEHPGLAIGNSYHLNGQPVIIQGVMKNNYTRPLSNTVDPVSLRYEPNEFNTIAISLSSDRMATTLSDIERIWKAIYPDHLFKYQFMNDALNREYKLADTIFSFLGTVSFLGIFIGCLGLYGLVSFMAIQRTKEIGIRKVFGATVTDIVSLFTRESSVLIGIAFVVAAPLAHFIGKAILMEFPDRVSPGINVFVLTLVGSLGIALATVAYRSFRAAVQNPGESLKNEG